ncbi:MAG: hypothetical protein WC782_04525 [Methylococcaceae bacterium]|jgi:hypothetical protein
MKTINALFVVLCFFVFSNSQAIDLGHGFTIKGFGTAGLVNSSNNGADFVANSNVQASGVGRTNDTSLVVDSKLGLQLDYQATDRLSFAVQGLSRQQYNKSFDPILEWAYVKFKILPELHIRAGRIRPAIYMLSDYLDVNYSNPWVRPPVEFYTTAAIDRMEGVDLLWRPSIGDLSWLVQPYFGVTDLKTPGVGNSFKADNILGINLTGTYSDLTLRAGFGQGDITLFSPSLTQAQSGLNIICNTGLDPIACAQYNAFNTTRKNVIFSSVGANWDNGNYFVLGEFGKRFAKTKVISDVTTWYISGGARINKFTPYITYSSYHNDSPVTFNGDTNNVFNLGLGAAVNQIATGLLQGGNAMDQNTISLGMRYDFMSKFALKAQWDHIQTSTKNGLAGTGDGLFVNQQAGFGNSPTQVDLFSVTLDFAF